MGLHLHFVFSAEADSVLSTGVWLGPDHRNWALTRVQALTAIDRLSGVNIVIVGGDVLEGPETNYRHTYDNWHFEPSTLRETNDVLLSALKASAYVNEYPLDDAYFVMVPGRMITTVAVDPAP